MVDVASIVVAIIALVGTLATGAATFFLQRSKDKYTRTQDEAKSRAESLRLVRKYNDPLARAASELQSRLWNICDGGFLDAHRGHEYSNLVIPYTAYLIGQYLTWEHILRIQAQFVGFDSNSGPTQDLNFLLGKITNVFSTSPGVRSHSVYTVWRGEQNAISEIMTVRETKDTSDAELLCIGFATFMQKWNGRDTTEPENDGKGRDNPFRDWFASVIDGTHGLQETNRQAERDHRGPRLTSRMRCLQHLLLDLTKMLDLKHAVYQDSFGKCEMSEMERAACPCSSCMGQAGQRKSRARVPERSRSGKRRETRSISPSLVDNEEPKDRYRRSEIV